MSIEVDAQTSVNTNLDGLFSSYMADGQLILVRVASLGVSTVAAAEAAEGVAWRSCSLSIGPRNVDMERLYLLRLGDLSNLSCSFERSADRLGAVANSQGGPATAVGLCAADLKGQALMFTGLRHQMVLGRQNLFARPCWPSRTARLADLNRSCLGRVMATRAGPAGTWPLWGAITQASTWRGGHSSVYSSQARPVLLGSFRPHPRSANLLAGRLAVMRIPLCPGKGSAAQ